MHVTHLDDHASPPTAFSAPPFRHKEWRNLDLAAGRLAANPSNGIIQQAPSVLSGWFVVLFCCCVLDHCGGGSW